MLPLLKDFPVLPARFLAPSQRVTALSELVSLRLSELKASGFVKLHEGDFEEALGTHGFWHINAMPCTHVVGRIYALARIVERPADPHDVFERVERAASPPPLDLACTPLVRCAETKVFASAAALPVGLLGQLLGCRHTPGSAQGAAVARILRDRYAATRDWMLEDYNEREVMVARFAPLALPADA